MNIAEKIDIVFRRTTELGGDNNIKKTNCSPKITQSTVVSD